MLFLLSIYRLTNRLEEVCVRRPVSYLVPERDFFGVKQAHLNEIQNHAVGAIGGGTEYLDLTVRSNSQAITRAAEMIRHAANEAEAAFKARNFP